MHEALAAVIRDFRAAQDLAVVTLRDRLGVTLPESNRAWSEWAHFGESPQQAALHELGCSVGLFIRTHGYGIEMRFPSLTIDFDWGECGEGYGFDTWRLWNHCCENRIYLDQFTYDLMELRVQKAVADGELVSDRLLHYLPHERERYGASSAGSSRYIQLTMQP
jgi:hypothetical protein